MQDFYPTLPKSDNTKAMIINCLANDWPLTTKQIHNKIVKENAVSISYQAIHKTVNELVETGVLEKSENDYRLNKTWVEQNIKFFSRLSEAYLKGEKESMEDLWKKEYVAKSFKSYLEFARFMMHNFFKFPTNGKRGMAILRKMYISVGFSKEELESIGEATLRNKALIISKSGTNTDQILGKAFENMGAEAVYGIETNLTHDLFIIGDHVCEVYFSEKLKKRWDTLWENPALQNNFNLPEVYDMIYSTDCGINIVIYKNVDVADKLRIEFFKYSKRK